MKTRNAMVVGLFLSVALSLETLAGAATPSSIMVVPARARMVNLAFQIAALKDVGIVSYGAGLDDKETMLHVWNGQEWIRISNDEYANGAFMTGTTDHVFIFGTPDSLPAFMKADPAWAKSTQRITALDVATILNDMGPTLKLSPRQWKWLAEKNGLSLTDNNAERRRYGRWGRSGIDTSIRRPASAPSVEVTMPPVDNAAKASPEIKPPAAPEIKSPAAPTLEPAPIAPAIPVKPDPTTK